MKRIVCKWCGFDIMEGVLAEFRDRRKPTRKPVVIHVECIGEMVAAALKLDYYEGSEGPSGRTNVREAVEQYQEKFKKAKKK